MWALGFLIGLRVALPDASAGDGLATLVSASIPALLLCLIASAAAKGALPLLPRRLLWPFIAFALWCGALAAFAPDRYAAGVTALARIAEASAFVLALWAIAVGKADARSRLAAIIVAAAALAATHAIFQMAWVMPGTISDFAKMNLIDNVAPDDRPALLSRLHTRRATGPFAIANTLAGLLLIGLPLALSVAWGAAASRAARARRIFAAAVALLFLIGLILSGSKGGAIAALFGLIVLTWGGTWRRRAFILGAALILIAAAILVPRARAAAWDSLAVRLDYFAVAVRMVQNAPLLGCGPGNFDDGFFAMKTPEVEETRHAHNAYLECAATTGLIGLAIFLSAWCAPLVIARRARHDPQADTEMPAPASNSTLRARVGDMAGFGIAVIGAMVVGRVIGAHASAPAPLEFMMRAVVLVVAVAAGLAIGAGVVSTRAWCAALAGLLLHSCVDFDLEIPGLAALGAIVAAAVAAPAVIPGRRIAIARGPAIVLAIVALGLAFWLLRFVGISDLKADAGRGAFLEAPPQSHEELSARLAATSAATEYVAIDSALWLRLARLLLEDMRMRATRGELDALARARGQAEVSAALDRALAVDPENAALCFESAQIHETMAGASDDLLRARAARDYAAATVLYPASPVFHYRRALFAHRHGNASVATREFTLALDLDLRLFERNRAHAGLTDVERELAKRALER